MPKATTRLLAMLGSIASMAALGQFTITPENPRVFETVLVSLTPASGCDDIYSEGIKVRMSNNRALVTIPVNFGSICYDPLPPAQSVQVAIGQLPPGDYEAEVQILVSREGHPTNTVTSRGVRQFTVSAPLPRDPVLNHTDLWWDSKRSGWGLNIVQHPGNGIFATWFDYDDNGRPVWYVVPEGQWSALSSTLRAYNLFTGPVYRTSGPVGGSMDPSLVTRTKVGQAQFGLFGWQSISATITIDGRTRQLLLQRQPF